MGEQTALRIGALVPEPGIYPLFGQSLMAGFDLYLDQVGREAGGRPIELVRESVGRGAESAVQKARHLLVVEGVDLILGLVGLPVVRALRDLLPASEKPLIVCNPGAHVMTPQEQSPYVFHSSLNLWQATWALGGWAAENVGQRAMVAISFYEGGYDLNGAFYQGFESAGGQVIHLYITHVPPDSGDPAPLLAAVEKEKPDLLCAFYSSLSAAALVRAYADSGLAGQIPLVGPGFLVEEDVLSKQGEAALGVRSGLSWAGSLRTPENEALQAAYQRRTGRIADALTVLGYDTARLIVEAVNAVEGDTDRAESLIGALESVEFNGPRGRFQMDSRTHSAINPLYLREVQRREGSIGNVVLGALPSIAEFDKRVEPLWAGLKSGWEDAYLA